MLSVQLVPSERMFG